MQSYHLLLQVYGDDNVVTLLQQLKPSVIIPFMNAEMQVKLAQGYACQHHAQPLQHLDAPP